MRFDELLETTADNQVEGEAGKRDPGDDIARSNKNSP